MNDCAVLCKIWEEFAKSANVLLKKMGTYTNKEGKTMKNYTKDLK